MGAVKRVRRSGNEPRRILAVMQVGLIGSGNMAGAPARGWGDPVLCTDAGSGRAAELAGELGGDAIGSNAELVRRADVAVLCHKPAQLEAVAAELDVVRDASR